MQKHPIRDAYHDKVSLHSDSSSVVINELKMERKLRVLTPEEREVYKLKERGLTKSEIAEKLFRSYETIKKYYKSIKSKIN